MSNDCPATPSGYPSDCEVTEGYRSMARERQGRPIAQNRQLVLARAKEIRLLLLDVDGVLTNGALHYSGSTGESKSFHTQAALASAFCGRRASIPASSPPGNPR